MRKRVIADFVAFGVLALENFGVLVGLLADDEEHGGNIFFLEDVENSRSPARIGAVIEGEHDFFGGRAADLVDIVGKRIFFVGFVGEEIGVRFVGETAAARFGSVGKMPNIAVAFESQ